MHAVITKPQKNKIMILGIILAVIGLACGSVGIYLKSDGDLRDVLKDVKDPIPQFTARHFGVMSGFMLFGLGTLGYSLVFSRIFPLVFLYCLFSLCCDVACLVDILLVKPYISDFGDYITITENCKNTTKTLAKEEVKNVDCVLIAQLLLFITVSLAVMLTLSTITTVYTASSLYQARKIDSPESGMIEMPRFSTPRHYERSSAANTVYQNDGFRK